ncbi:MAG: 16S rRNA (guanine(966)-N(2))-methyltransferase RsmD [Candidatus Saccharibacteria bacterium]
MLKITSGTYGGRKLVQPKTDKTRPVMERTRHAIFQVLGDVFGMVVLDLYAGSGALGLEALSNGAVSATFVDSSRLAQMSIAENVNNLEVRDQSIVKPIKVESFFEQNTAKYDLIFLDPPYAEFKLEILEAASSCLNDTGIIVVSCSMQTKLPEEIGLTNLVKIKRYGDTQIAYFRYTSL